MQAPQLQISLSRVLGFLKPACMAGWGAPPPHLQTPLSRVLRGSIWGSVFAGAKILGSDFAEGFWHLPSLDIVTILWSYDYELLLVVV